MERCFPGNSPTLQKSAVYGLPELKERGVYACPWREISDAYPETHFHTLFSFLNSLLCQRVKRCAFWGGGGQGGRCLGTSQLLPG